MFTRLNSNVSCPIIQSSLFTATQAFPTATIVRPAALFGDEDRLLNRIALISQTFPFMPLVNADTARLQPVYVDDVAQYIVEEGIANPATKASP